MRFNSLLVALTILGVGLAGCTSSPSDDGTTPTPTDDGTPQTTTLFVGTEAAFPPFEDINSDGDFVGFDIDVIREIGTRAGYTIELRNLGFDNLIPSVQNDQVDVAISAMSITEARSEVVDFSIGYYEANQAVSQRADDTRSYDSLEAMQGEGLVFGAQTGTVGADVVVEQFGEESLRRYDSYPLALQALRNGDVDAVVMDAPAQYEAATSSGSGITVRFEFSIGDVYGIAVRKGDAATLNAINDALEAMIDDGTLAQLRAKWGL